MKALYTAWANRAPRWKSQRTELSAAKANGGSWRLIPSATEMLCWQWTAMVLWSPDFPGSVQLSRAVLSVSLSFQRHLQWPWKLLLDEPPPKWGLCQTSCVHPQKAQQWKKCICLKTIHNPMGFVSFFTESQCCWGWQGLLQTLQSNPNQPAAGWSIFKDGAPTAPTVLPHLLIFIHTGAAHEQQSLKTNPSS